MHEPSTWFARPGDILSVKSHGMSLTGLLRKKPTGNKFLYGFLLNDDLAIYATNRADRRLVDKFFTNLAKEAPFGTNVGILLG